MNTKQNTSKRRMECNSNSFYLIVAIAMGAAIAPLGVVAAFGQEPVNLSEIERLRALYAHLGQFGYTEIADLTADGSLVEFRSNGTIALMEDTAGDIVEQYGFTLIEFAPAPPITEDSIIIVSMNRGLVL